MHVISGVSKRVLTRFVEVMGIEWLSEQLEICGGTNTHVTDDPGYCIQTTNI